MSRLVYLKDVVTLSFQPEKCLGCGTCLDVCPHGVIVRDNGRVRIEDRDACMECGACARNCPAEALNVRSGVGCAVAIINSALRRKSDSCCSVTEPEKTAPPACAERTPRSSCCS